MYMNNNFGTGIWNNLKNPYVYSSAAIGAGIGVYEANTVPNIHGGSFELGALGAITGAVIGKGLKHISERPVGLPFWR
jgi:outer membrane lipoprotein SlyB